jgi:Tfp pilus assembly protein PilX
MRLRRSEYGGFLVIAIVMVTMLTLVGLVVMQSVTIDTESAGAERTGETARYIAEAGARRGVNQLNYTYDLFNNQSISATLANVRADAGVTTVAQSDPDCENDPDCPFIGWLKLPVPTDATAETDDKGVASTRYPNTPADREGWYRVYLGDDAPFLEDDPAKANGVILIRALGRAEGGARRIIEVAIQEMN